MGTNRCRTLLYFFPCARYYRGTHGVIIVYDVTNGESFANVKRWLQEIEHNCDVVNKVLGKTTQCSNHKTKLTQPRTRFTTTVGNKNDDPNRKVVITEDAQRFARQMDIQLFETSAKDNLNVDEMFHMITEKVLSHKLVQNAQNAQQTGETINLKRTHGKKKSKCC